jgi:hypothetical protein
VAQGDLATLSDVKAWLSISDTTQDAVLARLITAVSASVRTYINRSTLTSRTCTDRFDGSGTQSHLLQNWPVTSVASVVVDGVLIPQSPAVPTTGAGYTTSGWVLSSDYRDPPGQPQLIHLGGYCFDRGRQNCQVVYTAGYLTAESASVPVAPYQYQVAGLGGPWAGDSGVVYLDTGLPLTLVVGAPAAGQYSVSAATTTGSPGLYQFAAADLGRPVQISYSFVPFDLEQVVIELVGERNSYRSRIGQRSKSLGGQETMSWDMSGMPAYAVVALQQWTDVVPYPL